jgi:hypothetical protein
MFGSKEDLTALIGTITNNNDFYLVCEDFASYCEAQAKVITLKKYQILIRLMPYTKTRKNGSRNLLSQP